MGEKFERDEIERRLKDALRFAFEDAVLDDEISIDAEGPFPIITQYDLDTNEPMARFEIRFEIQEIK